MQHTMSQSPPGYEAMGLIGLRITFGNHDNFYLVYNFSIMVYKITKNNSLYTSYCICLAFMTHDSWPLLAKTIKYVTGFSMVLLWISPWTNSIWTKFGRSQFFGLRSLCILLISVAVLLATTTACALTPPMLILVYWWGSQRQSLE